MEGRLYRTQSLSTVSTKGRAASVDPFAGISKIRDDDFRKSILDKVNRVQRSLSVRPEGDDASRSRSRQRRYSITETTAPATVYLPIKTALHSGVILPSGGSVEYWPTTVTDPDGLAVKYSRVGIVQPELLRRDVDKLALPPAVVISRKRVIDEADDAVSRGGRISALLQHLKTSDGPQSRYQQEIDNLAAPSRVIDRAEVDSFAAVLNKLTLPTLRGPKSTDLRYRGPLADPVASEDFQSRLAHATGDLQRVEGLASKAFHWNDRPVGWTSSALKTIESKTAAVEPISDAQLLEIRTTQLPREIFTFYNDRSVGIKQTDTAADQAIRWAQQRRVQLENELDNERKRERYSIHNLPSTVSALGLVPRSRFPRAQEEVDEYVYDDDVGFTPHYVPTVVRPWSSTSRGLDGGAPAIATIADFEPPTRSYARSLSASNVELGRSADRTSRFSAQPSDGATKRYSAKSTPAAQQSKPGMSEARRRVREVLAKSKGDPNYFENRAKKNNDDYDYDY